MEQSNTTQKTSEQENKFPFQAILMLGVLVFAVVMMVLKFSGIL